MAKLIRMITKDASAVAAAIDSTDIAAEIERIHKTSAVVTAGLGRLATACSLMGYNLKGADDKITVKINGGGPVGTMIAVGDSKGNVKAYAANPVVEIPLNKEGKLDVGGAVGKDGTLCIIKDLGLKEPYVGQIPIVSGEIAEDITSYYAVSEQTPTVCALGVLVNPDLTVRAAGGYIVQLLPFADEKIIDTIEENLKHMLPVSQLIDLKTTPQQICEKLLAGLEPEVLDESETFYKCDCSRERISKALISMGKEELEKLRDEQETTEVVCHFCDKKYQFTASDIDKLLNNK